MRLARLLRGAASAGPGPRGRASSSLTSDSGSGPAPELGVPGQVDFYARFSPSPLSMKQFLDFGECGRVPGLGARLRPGAAAADPGRAAQVPAPLLPPNIAAAAPELPLLPSRTDFSALQVRALVGRVNNRGHVPFYHDC